MSKNQLFILSLAIILITAYLTLAINALFPQPLSKIEIETATNQARHLYQQEQEKGRDFSNGPCISDALLPNWVADIAHNPRLPIDDLAQNQCPGYLEGRTQHFVELDTEGNLIRAK